MDKSVKVIATKINDKKTYDILINSISSLIIKGGGFIISFVSMPLYINYFHNEQVLGMWFTLLSILSWIFTFDLGLGNGLRNKLVEVLDKKDDKLAKMYISSTYTMLGSISIVISIVLLIVFKYVNWNLILNVNNNIVSANTLLITVTILFIGIMINFWLKLINSVLYALQKPAINNLLLLITSIFQLVYLIIVNGKSIDVELNLIKLSCVYVITINLPLIIASILVFNKDLKYCKPTIRNSSLKIAQSILKVGGIFFIVQIAFMLIMSTNEIIISNIYGANYVVEYQVYYRIFMAIGTVFSLALTPIWSSVTKAVVDKEFQWLKKINKVIDRVTLFAVVVEIIIIPLIPIIVKVWLGKNAIDISYLHCVLFSIFGSLFIINISLTTIANGIGYLNTQLYCYSLGTIFKLPVIMILNIFYYNWINVVISNILILLVFTFIQNLWLRKFIKEKIDNI